MECEQANELLAAFAMNRLDPDEQAEVLEHLAACRLHDTELAAFQALAGALPMTVDEMRPPDRLRRNLLAAFETEAAPPAQPAVKPVAQGGLLGWLWRVPQFGYGLAAALAIAVIGLAVWNVSLQSDGDDSIVVREVQQGDRSLRVLYLPDDQIAVIDVDMPALAANQTYQAWQIPAQGAPISLGLIENEGAFAFNADLAGAAAIAISVEPAGGSPQPTTTPVIVQEL